MAGYLGAIPVPQATQHRETFTATSGQTTFNTAGYTVGFLDVYLNGSHLSPADFTATNGSDVVLASGASAGDVCDIISYTAFEVADQTFTGTTTLTGNLLLGDNDKAIFGAGSDLQIYHDGSNSYIKDVGTGDLTIAGTNLQIRSSATNENFIYCVENGAVNLYHNDAQKLATTSTGIDVTGAITADGLTVDGAVVFNEASADVDFRVESNGNANMLFVDGGNNRVGIGTSSPSGSLHVYEASTAGSYIFLENTDGSTRFQANNDSLFIDAETHIFRDSVAGGSGEYMRIDSSGRVGIGTSSPSALMHISGGSTATDGIHYIATNTSSGPAGIVMNSGHGNWKIINSQTVANALEFIDGGSPDVTRMIIDSSGQLLLGTTVNVYGGADRYGFNFFTGGAFNQSVNDTAANFLNIENLSTTRAAFTFSADRATKGSITVSSSATAYNTSSDYRLKTDAQPMTGASARVLALNPVNFEWIADGTRVDGFLAHEAQAVVPEAVTGTKDGMMDEEYQVSAATGDIYTPATDAYVDEDGNDVDAVDEIIHSADVEQPETLANGQQWRETTAAVMGTRSVPDMQGIDQSKLVPLLVASLQEALARITALEG